MSATKLTDTQLVTLSAASRREDRGIVLPPNLKGGAAQKLLAKLIDLGFVEEVRARGDLPAWRRDDEKPMALRITQRGLKAIAVEEADESPASTKAESADQDAAPGEAKPARRKPPSGSDGESGAAAQARGGRAGSKQAPNHCAPPAAGGDDNRSDHEGDGMAAALGARFFRGRSTHEARADAGLGKDWG
jgi:hypothetical protein